MNLMNHIIYIMNSIDNNGDINIAFISLASFMFYFCIKRNKNDHRIELLDIFVNLLTIIIFFISEILLYNNFMIEGIIGFLLTCIIIGVFRFLGYGGPNS